MKTNVLPKEIMALSLMLLGFCVFFGVSAYSQSKMSPGSPCLSGILLYLGDTAPYPCEATADGQGPFSYMCYYWNYHCPCRSCALAGAPINLTDGNTYIEQQDLAIPGLGGGLRLVRSWNSLWPGSLAAHGGGFGGYWASTYEERIFPPGSDGSWTYARGDGSFWWFQQIGGQFQLTSPANENVSLTSGRVAHPFA